MESPPEQSKPREDATMESPSPPSTDEEGDTEPPKKEPPPPKKVNLTK